jgi:hypothetical protein
LQREDLRDRLVRLLGSRQMHATVAALDDAAQRVSRYLLMQALINGVQGCLVGIGPLPARRAERPALGRADDRLRFVPYLGPALAAAGPIVLAIAVFPGWLQPLAVVGLIVTLELITNNVLEPRLYGSSVGVSAFALLVAAVFWTWLWGVAGLFLATPLTVCLVVMGKYIPQLEFLGVLLGDQPVLELRERYYQRLLANDVEEAQDLIDEALKEGTLLDLCDRVVLPALRFIEQDHERGVIDDARRAALIDQVGRDGRRTACRGRARADASADAPADGAPLAEPGGPHVGAAAAGRRPRRRGRRADARQGARAARVRHDVPSAATLKSEMLDLVERRRPDAICVSAAPPAAVVRARYLGKKLTAVAPGVPVLVGLWDAQGDLTKARQRLESAGLRPSRPTPRPSCASWSSCACRCCRAFGVRNRNRALRNRATAEWRSEIRVWAAFRRRR